MKNSIFNTIIVPIDLAHKNNSIESVFNIALNMTTNYNAKLYLIHVIPEFGQKMYEDYLPRGWKKDQKQLLASKMQQLIDKYIPKEIEVDFKIDEGSVYDRIINYANHCNADVIVLPAVRPQHKDYMLGSNASKIVRHAEVSVLVVRA